MGLGVQAFGWLEQACEVSSIRWLVEMFGSGLLFRRRDGKDEGYSCGAQFVLERE